MNEEKWEDLCRRCGECCFEKWIDGDGTIYPTNEACQHLDIVTRECRVYHKRFEVGEGCMKLTPEVVEVVQWLPETCAYVQQIQKRQPDRARTAGRKRSRRQRQ